MVRNIVCAFLLTFAWLSHAETALDDYLAKPEPAYGWTLHEQRSSFIPPTTSYDLRLVSQTWKGIEWTHQLRIVVPANLQHPSRAILFITDGDTRDGEPIYDSSSFQTLFSGVMATNNRAIVALLYQVPNQPLFGNLKEDDLIAYTFRQFIDTGDEEWPLLLPMTKSAIQAMNAIQEFAASSLETQIDDFIIAGASKRGWTTWMTAASGDPRVDSIVPIVFDTLKLETQMDYQLEVWGAYSDYIREYVLLGIPELRRTPEGERLIQIVDPYSYLDRLSQPAHIVIATNDPYWPLDAVKHYYHDLPNEVTLRYFPNVGHALGASLADAVEELSEFAASRIEGIPWPRLTWSTRIEGGSMIVDLETDTTLSEISVWSTRSETRDFRSAAWVEEKMTVTGPSWTIERPLPEEGYEAFFVQTGHSGPRGMLFTICTEAFALSGGAVHVSDWALY